MLGIVLKRWNWLDRILIPLSVAILQSVCIAPIFAAILREPSTGIDDTGFVFWLCLGIILGGALVAQLASKNSMGAVMVVVGATASVLVTWLLVLPPQTQDLGVWFSDALDTLVHFPTDRLPLSLVGLIFAVLSWWRGIKSAHPEYENLVGMFAIGMVIQLGILFGSFRAAAATNWLLLGRILLFLSSAMVSFSFLQISRTIREQERRTGVIWRIDRYWMTIIAGVVTGMLLIGLIIAQFISPNQIDFLRPVWNAILNIILFIVLILAYLFFSLLEPFLAQIARERPGGTRPFQSLVQPQMSLEDIEQNPANVPPILFQVFQILVIVFGIILVVWILIRALRKRTSSDEIEGVLEERESILSPELIKSQVQSLLKGFRRRRLSPFLDLVGEEDRRRVVREMYQHILAHTATSEMPRRKGQTPSAYKETLFSYSFEERAAWETITRVYNVARYGLFPPTQDQVQMAQDAFARIEPLLRKRETEQTF
jgi:hypothetical protein